MSIQILDTIKNLSCFSSRSSEANLPEKPLGKFVPKNTNYVFKKNEKCTSKSVNHKAVDFLSSKQNDFEKIKINSGNKDFYDCFTRSIVMEIDNIVRAKKDKEYDLLISRCGNLDELFSIKEFPYGKVDFEVNTSPYQEHEIVNELKRLLNHSYGSVGSKSDNLTLKELVKLNFKRVNKISINLREALWDFKHPSRLS